MRGMSTSARPRAPGFLARFGGGVIAGSIAGSTACSAQGAEPTPAQIVNFRFPPGWNRVAAAPPAVRVAEAGDAGMPPLALFSPHPTYPLGAPQAEAEPAALPARVLAYAAPEAQAPAGRAKPPAAAARPSLKQPGPVFNDAQLASIKKRLNLTPDQERMWPAVETALRSISYQRISGVQKAGTPASAARAMAIDPNSAEVQRFKYAAFPLLMSFSEDQKREVRTLAHLMGLERVAAQF